MRREAKVSITYNDLWNCASFKKKAEYYGDILEYWVSQAEFGERIMRQSGITGQGAQSSAVETTVAKILDLKQEWQNEIDAYIEHVVIIKEVIDTLEDEEQRAVMIAKYVDGLIWAEVAKKCHMAQSTAIEKHDRALEILGIAKIRNQSECGM